MRIGVLVDGPAILAYATGELPAGLALGELIREVLDGGELPATSALSVNTYRPRSVQEQSILDTLLESGALLVLPFTGDDARRSFPTDGPPLAAAHTALLAARFDVDVATANAKMWPTAPDGPGILDLTAAIEP